MKTLRRGVFTTLDGHHPLPAIPRGVVIVDEVVILAAALSTGGGEMAILALTSASGAGRIGGVVDRSEITADLPPSTWDTCLPRVLAMEK